MNRRLPSPERPRMGEADSLRAKNTLRAEDAPRQRRLAEMERTIAMQITASRILWTYASDEREPGGVER